jgi:hypothetical protein
MTAAFLALMLVASGGAPTMLALKEAGPWNVEFADKLCVLSRPYSASEQKLTLAFKAELVGRSHEFMIVRSQSSTS